MVRFLTFGQDERLVVGWVVVIVDRVDLGNVVLRLLFGVGAGLV